MVDVAGPLCFQGDYQARDVELPLPSDGDILAIHDTGAYTMSMYCRYLSILNCLLVLILQIVTFRFNSILASPVYGIRRVDDDIQFICFKKRETVEECLSFWGLQENEISSSC